MTLADVYLNNHLKRVIYATRNLWKQPGSICANCHQSEDTICMFCFCPLYKVSNCGGNYKILENGVKDCSACERPHDPEFALILLKTLYEPEIRQLLYNKIRTYYDANNTI